MIKFEQQMKNRAKYDLKNFIKFEQNQKQTDLSHN